MASICAIILKYMYLGGLNSSWGIHISISLLPAYWAECSRGSILGWVIPETQKWYLMLPCIIRYRSRVKWSNPHKEWWQPSLHLGKVANEKGAFRPLSPIVANFAYFLPIKLPVGEKMKWLLIHATTHSALPFIQLPFI